MGASRFHYLPELFAFFLKATRDSLEHGIKFFQLDQCGQAHGGREDIIGGLPVVDMIVGMNSFVLAQLAAEKLFCAIGDYFV